MKPIVRIFVLLFVLGISFTSCSSDDGDSNSNPVVSYGATTINAQFFTAGESVVPTVNWNGDQGSFSLVGAPTGLTIDSSTGRLSWPNSLDTGSFEIQVTARNGNGQTTVDLTLENPFQGIFTGTYSFQGDTFYLQYQFNGNGTMIARANDPVTPLVGSGTYEKSGNVLQLSYNDQNGNPFEATGRLELADDAVLTGSWTYFDGSRGSYVLVMD